MWFWLLLGGCVGTPGGGEPPANSTSCATGELLDGEDCVPEACGVGTWGNIAGAAVYVDVAAGEGGDGSEGAPLRSIQAGLDRAATNEGGIVAVAAGSYVETIAMGDDHRNVTLAGRCRAMVTIDGSEGDDVPTIDVSGDRRTPTVGIQGVTVTGGTYTGLAVEQAVVSVTASDVRESAMVGILVFAATVTLEDVGVYGTMPNRAGEFGRGIDVETRGTLTATGCTVQGNTDVGVFAGESGTTVDLVDTEVLDTLPDPDGIRGRGVSVVEGATLTAVGCTVRGNADAGVYASDAGTTVDLVDTSVLDTLPGPGDAYGRGIAVSDAATLTATGCTIQGNTESGVVAASAGTLVDLVDTQVLDTSPSPDNTAGRGVSVVSGATLTVTGGTIRGNSEGGLYVTDAGTKVDLVDAQVLDTSSSSDGSFGEGIWVQRGAALTADGSTIQGNATVGVIAFNVGTTVDLVDTWILDTAPGHDDTGGHGINVQDGAALSTIGCTIQGNTESGLFASNPGTLVDLVDTEILDTAPSPDGTEGRGIGIQSGAVLVATGCILGENTEVGVVAAGASTTVDLVDTEIRGTRRGRVTGFALGVAAQQGALVRISDSEVSGTEGPGVYVLYGRMELDRVTLTGNQFSGAAAGAGDLVLRDSTITDTLPDPEWGGGFGVYASDHFGAPTVTLTDSTIGPHDYAAVWLDGQGAYDIQGNALFGSEGVDDDGWALHGNAVFAERGVTAWDGASGLRLSANTLDGASEVAMLLDGASAELDGNIFSGNGVELWQQRCDDIVAVAEGDPDWEICPESGNLLTAYDLIFTSLYLPEVDPLE